MEAVPFQKRNYIPVLRFWPCNATVLADRLPSQLFEAEQVNPVRCVREETVRGSGSRGRHPKRWKDGLKEKLEELGSKEEGVQDRGK